MIRIFEAWDKDATGKKLIFEGEPAGVVGAVRAWFAAHDGNFISPFLLVVDGGENVAIVHQGTMDAPPTMKVWPGRRRWWLPTRDDLAEMPPSRHRTFNPRWLAFRGRKNEPSR